MLEDFASWRLERSGHDLHTVVNAFYAFLHPISTEVEHQFEPLVGGRTQ